jgi:transposase
METIYRCCAGLDVHKRHVEVNVRRLDEGGQLHSETRRYGTFTRELFEMSDWLWEEGVTHVAMESTGVFWKPIYNILEGRFEVLLVNAAHVKQVPGRKTDVADCQWLAQLLQYGLLKGSLVPSCELRQLRDLTRQRAQLVSEKTRVANRIHKVLEDANIKLASVATDILGVSGRAMIEEIIAGEDDSIKLASHARRRLKNKTPELTLALEGHVNEHHRFMLGLLWQHLSQLESLIERLEQKIDEQMAPFEPALELIDEIPGIDRRVAQSIIAEIGTDMSPFPTDMHLSSWAGMCPGNNESAGKRKSGKTTKGSRWLRQSLVQAAWAASHAKGSYFAAQYSRLARRRGRKRALVAVGHSMLVTIYYMLKHSMPYQDLGADYFDKRNQQYLTNQLVKRLEALGHKVTLEPQKEAA